MEILCIGLNSYDIFYPVEEFPAEDRKYKSSVVMETAGGPAATAACLLGRWGAPTGYAGSLSPDSYGEIVRKDFIDSGIDLSCAEIRDDYRTSLSWIIINRANGSRTVLNRRDEEDVMQGARFMERLRLSGWRPSFILMDGHEIDASRAACDLFPDAVTVLDAGSVRDSTRELLPRVTHVICSEPFALQLTGMERIETDLEKRECCRMIARCNPRPGAVTLGRRGLTGWDGAGGCFSMDAFPADTKDTTGAGDIFHGAFVWFLYSGYSFRAALLNASAAAALSVEKPGGRNSIPDTDAVLRRAAGGAPKMVTLE